MNNDRDESKAARPALKRRPDLMTAAAVVFLAAALFVFILDGAGSEEEGREVPADSSVSASSSLTVSVPIIPATGSTSRKVTEPSSETSKEAVPAVVSLTSKTTSAPETSAPKTSAVKKTAVSVTPRTSATTAQTSTVMPETETAPPETTVSETTAASSVTTTVSTTSVTTTSTAPAVSFPADINKLTYEELLTVPGVGEKIAGDIVYMRERLGIITDMEQLLELYGIGDEKLGQLKAYLFVSESDYRSITQSTVVTTTSEITVRETEPPVRKPVNINTADESEIAAGLLISREKAAAIVSTREMIGGFTSPDELRLVSGLTENELGEISAYIII